MSHFDVTRSGMLSLMVDGGRYGYSDLGITQSGPADRYSAALANKLLHNRPDAPLLEVNMGGLSLTAHAATNIAFTGGQAHVKINGESRRLWHTHRIEVGDTIEIGMVTQGLRLYLAVSGGFEADAILGSASVSLRDRIGQALSVGDQLACQDHKSLIMTRTISPYLVPDFSSPLRLRFVVGYQDQTLGVTAKTTLTAAPYRVTNATDRMGARLEGTAIVHSLDILSEPIAYGAIQIPPDGQPIVMLNERQTIGGYPKIGSVIPMDAYRLAQARPGAEIVFEEIGLKEAIEVEKQLGDFLADPA